MNQSKSDATKHNTPFPFKVGDKVHTTFRTGGTVIEVDPVGNHGFGSIQVLFEDGTILGGMFIGHDFTKEAP